MRALVLALVLTAVPARAGMMAVAELAARVEGFAGRPAVVDPRLLLPDCAAPAMAWVGGSVAVRCAAPAWEVFVPVVAAPAAQRAVPVAPTVRRGERVMVEAEGPGFVVAMEAVAEQDARDGRVMVRAGAKRLLAVIDDDGRVRIRGLSGMVNRR